jgi:hypothetical protein
VCVPHTFFSTPIKSQTVQRLQVKRFKRLQVKGQRSKVKSSNRQIVKISNPRAIRSTESAALLPLYEKPKKPKHKPSKTPSKTSSKTHESDVDDFVSVTSNIDTKASTIQHTPTPQVNDEFMAAASPSAPPSNMFKPPKPAPFTGEKRDSETVNNFLYQVKIYCRASGVTTEDSTLDVVALLLSSRASSWFQLNESSFAGDYSIFEDKFRANFTPPTKKPPSCDISKS